MLVCRDLEKAEKLYGFMIISNETLDFCCKLLKKEKGLKNDFWVSIDMETGILKIEKDGNDSRESSVISDLDFLYDMIKDGVIEKV